MKKLKYRRRLLLVIVLMLAIAGFGLFSYRRGKQTREHRPIVSFATAKPVLEANPGELPAALKEPNEGKWKSWAQHEDNVVRTRLEQGALDSMVNLLLFGTSFTTQPRVITMNDFGDPVVQARVTDLVKHCAIRETTSALFFSETFSEAAESTRTIPPAPTKLRISFWKIFDALSRSRILFANRLIKQGARATRRLGFPSAHVCFVIAAFPSIPPFCRALASTARYATWLTGECFQKDQ